MIKLTELVEYTIYVDMDGVLADFDKQFESLMKLSPTKYEDKFGKSKFWNAIGKYGVKYWTEMPWMSDGKQLWNFVKGKNAIILSSPPSTKADDARKGKKMWCTKHLGSDVDVILEREKQKYAHSRAILIDDTKKKIDKFRAKGGIGILHKNTAKTLSELKEILNG